MHVRIRNGWWASGSPMRPRRVKREGPPAGLLDSPAMEWTLRIPPVVLCARTAVRACVRVRRCAPVCALQRVMWRRINAHCSRWLRCLPARPPTHQPVSPSGSPIRSHVRPPAALSDRPPVARPFARPPVGHAQKRIWQNWNHSP